MGRELGRLVNGENNIQWEGENDEKWGFDFETIIGDVKYSIGNIVNNIVITMCGVRWVLHLYGDHVLSYTHI